MRAKRPVVGQMSRSNRCIVSAISLTTALRIISASVKSRRDDSNDLEDFTRRLMMRKAVVHEMAETMQRFDCSSARPPPCPAFPLGAEGTTEIDGQPSHPDVAGLHPIANLTASPRSACHREPTAAGLPAASS